MDRGGLGEEEEEEEECRDLVLHTETQRSFIAKYSKVVSAS